MWVRRLLRVSLVLLVLAAAAGGGAWWWVDRWLHAPGPLSAPATVELPRGSGLAVIAARLEAAGAVDDDRIFALVARLTGRDRGLKAGEYRLEPRMSPLAIVALLQSGKVLQHPVAVPEGLTVKEVFALLAGNQVLSGELPPLPPEGTLLPETYLVPRGEPRASVVERMAGAMRAALDAAWQRRRPGTVVRSPQEALVLASIIEKETALPQEYRLVSAVFHNRLRRGMKLQTDPTVIYGLADGRGPLGRELTRADLALPNPYNTYLVDGLPPGPIANPGTGALAAAVEPAPVDYLYFVANGDGGHTFAATLAEHNRNVARWRGLRRGPDR